MPHASPPPENSQQTNFNTKAVGARLTGYKTPESSAEEKLEEKIEGRKSRLEGWCDELSAFLAASAHASTCPCPWNIFLFLHPIFLPASNLRKSCGKFCSWFRAKGKTVGEKTVSFRPPTGTWNASSTHSLFPSSFSSDFCSSWGSMTSEKAKLYKSETTQLHSALPLKAACVFLCFVPQMISTPNGEAWNIYSWGKLNLVAVPDSVSCTRLSTTRARVKCGWREENQ